MARTLMGLVVVVPLLIGTNGPCPKPNYPAIENCPFPVDPNLVEGKLLGWLRVEVGKQLAHTRPWCDPDGDSAVVEILDAPEGVKIINKPRIASYTLLWRPARPTITAIVVRITDRPITGQPESDIGTLLVQVVPATKLSAPRLCGGQPR